MPWSPEQWRAIAASTIRRLGPVAGKRKLEQYKREAGGHAVDPSLANEHIVKKHHKKRRKHGPHH